MNRGQRRPFFVGEDHARQRIRIAAAQLARASVQLLDVHADRRRRHRDRHQVAGVSDGKLEVTAPQDWLAVRPAALAAGPVEAHLGLPLAGAGRDHRLGQPAADQEALAIRVAPVGGPALPLGVVEQAGQPRRSVPAACPPDLGGPVRRNPRSRLARRFRHSARVREPLMIADRHTLKPELPPAPRVTCVRRAQPVNGTPYRLYPVQSAVHWFRCFTRFHPIPAMGLTMLHRRAGPM